MGHGGVVYGFNPMLSAILPSFLFFLFALWQMQRLKQ
jgi:lipopolysaccharide export LptBFGC system permease protein LptF